MPNMPSSIVATFAVAHTLVSFAAPVSGLSRRLIMCDVSFFVAGIVHQGHERGSQLMFFYEFSALLFAQSLSVK